MVGENKLPSESKLPGLPGYHPYDIQPQLLAVGVGAAVIGFVSVLLRLQSRWITRQSLWWDDWMNIFAGVSDVPKNNFRYMCMSLKLLQGWSLAALGLVFAMRAKGLGLHMDVLDPERTETMLLWILIAENLYAWSLAWIKLSVLLMYYRLFDVVVFRKQALVVGGAVMAWAVCITFLFVFTCVPVKKLWKPEVEGRCISMVGVYVSNGISTIITDVAILLLPAPQILRLQIRKLVKVGLLISFGLGGV